MNLTERKWGAVAPTPLTQDGTTAGLVTLVSTVGLFVKQRIVLQMGSATINVQIKKFNNRFSFWVGDPLKPLTDRTDVSQFTVSGGAFLYAEEQERANVPKDDQYAATYAEEPILARRVIDVDERGDYYNSDNPYPTIPGGDQIIPPEWDEIDIVRDCGDTPYQYRYYLEGVLVGVIDVTRDCGGVATKYKKGPLV